MEKIYNEKRPRNSHKRSSIVTLLCIVLVSLLLGVFLLLRTYGCPQVVAYGLSFDRTPQASDAPPSGRRSSQRSLASLFAVSSASNDQETGKQFLKRGDIVQLLGINPSGQWKVRRITRKTEARSATGSVSKQQQRVMDPDEANDSSPEDTADDVTPYHIMLTNYQAKSEDEVSASIDDEIDVLDGGDTEYWFIDNVSADRDGLVPEYLVQKVTEEQYKRLHKEDASPSEARQQRLYVVNGLVDGERKYVTTLRYTIENHLAEMGTDDLPEALVGKTDEIFSNLREIYAFHSRTILYELEAAINEPDDVARVFLKHKTKLKLYHKYIRDRVSSEMLLRQPEVEAFFKEFQEDTDDELSVSDYLNKPLERLKEYKFSLQELLKYTSRANLNCKDVEEALEVAAELSRQADSVLHIASLESYTGEIPLQKAGDLHRQGSLLFWDDKPRGKGKKREIFLFDKLLINARIKECGKKYICKFAMNISNLGLTEDIDGEPTKWALWVGNSAHVAVVLHTFEAKTVEAKESWVNEIKELLEVEGGQRISRHGKESSKHGPALKEKLVTNDGFEDILREIEKQYIIVTAPKVPPKPKIRPPSTTDENGGRPVIQKNPGYIRAKPGEKVVFTCEFSGDPEPTVSWTKNDIPVKDYGRFSIVNEKGRSELTIDHIVFEDAGKYQIMLKNQFGAAWSPGVLDMSEPPVITEAPKGVVGRVGHSALFPCKYEAIPAPSIVWTKNDVVLKSQGRFQIVTEKNFTSLEIDDLQKSDDGNYKVSLENSAGSAWAWAQLLVINNVENEELDAEMDTTSAEQFPTERQGSDWTRSVDNNLQSSPQFTKCPQSQTARPGSDVTLSSEYQGDPEPAVTWNKDSKPLQSKGRVNITTTPGSSDLKISNVMKEDGGTYQIVLKNQWGYAWCSANLVVAEKTEQPNITDAPSGVVAKVGENAIFPCDFEGLPEPSVSWSKDGEPIETGGRYHIVIEHGFTELEVTNVTRGDAGNYRVSLKNVAGFAWAEAGLVVTGGKRPESVGESTPESGNTAISDDEAPDESLLIEGLEPQQVNKLTALALTVKVKHSASTKPKIVWKKDGKIVHIGRARLTYDKGVAALKITRSENNDAGLYSVEIESGSEKCESSASVVITDLSKNQNKKSNGPVAGKGTVFSNFKPKAASAESAPAEKTASADEESNAKKEETVAAAKEEVSKAISVETQKQQVNGEKEESGSKESEQSLLLEKLEDQEVTKWAAVTLTAKIQNSGTKPKIVWKKDGKPVSMGRVRLSYDKGVVSLKIMRCEYNDSGVYTVQIDAGSENCESSATVEVSDIPQPPFPPTASEITANSVKVTWRAANDGNTPITSYLLEYRASSEKDWTAVPGDITTTSHLVEGLSPKTRYNFRVSATNKRGSSKPSRTSAIVEMKS